ncbi:SMI1/KNR4 family protein [Kribbella sp. NBC_01245]|uniref:SMI1/KNR4 family protein n=1 Tax=Kribbella sp. NBC_01245 TaxID=2903578 RepID=UPI002E2D4F45|nr:SMI1/KNR4 family protein [Kribbella sp. NBC_01245]
MEIAWQWREIEKALESAPVVRAALGAPATEAELDQWAGAIGQPLPDQLRELYQGHNGTPRDVRDSSRFSFVGNWYPIPISYAIEKYVWLGWLTEAYGIPRVIPFAEDISGCYLAISSDTGRREVLDCFNDGPPHHGFHDVEALMAETVVGLRGWHPEERADFPDGGLHWVSRLWDEDDD